MSMPGFTAGAALQPSPALRASALVGVCFCIPTYQCELFRGCGWFGCIWACSTPIGPVIIYPVSE